MGKKENVADIPVGTPIWIFWDDDQTFYKGQVWAFIENGTKMTVFYPENEEQEDIDIADFENGTIMYSLEDPTKEQARTSAVVPEVAETRTGRVSQSGNPLIQQLRKLGKALHDIEDRLPVEGLATESDSVWQVWRTCVATSKTIDDMAMMLIFLSQEMKPNVTTQWWREESKYWRVSAASSQSVDELQEYIMDLLTLAIDWEAARSFFPTPAEPYPEGTMPPTPRKHRVTLLQPRKRRKFESVRPAGPAKGGPLKTPKPLKGGEKHMLMLKRLGKLKKGTKKLKMMRTGGVEDGASKAPKKLLKRKREDGEGGVNKRPKSAVKKVGGPPRPPLVMPALPPLGEKLSAEGLDGADGVVPATVPVVCNGVQADYIPAQHMVACRCPQCGGEGKLLTCQQFEAHTGSRAKKWKETIRLAALPGTRLSEWLSLMEKKGASGVAFVAIEKKRVKALTSPTDGGASRDAGPSSITTANGDAAKLRKAFAAKLAKERKKPSADVAMPTADVAQPAQVGAASAHEGEPSLAPARLAAAGGDDVAARNSDSVARDPSFTQAKGRSDWGSEGRVGDGGHWPDDVGVREPNSGIGTSFEPPEGSGREQGSVENGKPQAREERAQSPEEDPLAWFQETYVSPGGASQSVAAHGMYMPLDDLFPS